MTDTETLIWRGERHAARSSTVALLLLLDSTPEWGRLRAFHERAARLLPRMRERVLEPAVPVGSPAWVPDDGFDLDRHLRRTRLPARTGRAGLLSFAGGLRGGAARPGPPASKGCRAAGPRTC